MIEHIILADGANKIVHVKRPQWLANQALEKPKSYNGFMGVSQGKPYFSKDNIEAYFRFALGHFDKFLLIVDDWLAQHNYAAFRGLSDEQALQKARFEGQKNIRAFESVKRKLQQENYEVDRIRIASLSELIDEQVRQRIEIIERHYQQDPKFRKDARAWLWKYIKNEARESGLQGEALEVAVDRSIKYLIQELALLNTMPERGYQVETYPGSNSVQKNIFEGKYTELGRELNFSRDYGFMEVNVTDPLLVRLSKYLADPGKQARRKMLETLHVSLVMAGLLGMGMLGGIGVYASFKEGAERNKWHKIQYGTEVCNHEKIFGGRAGPTVSTCYSQFIKRP